MHTSISCSGVVIWRYILWAGSRHMVIICYFQTSKRVSISSKSSKVCWLYICRNVAARNFVSRLAHLSKKILGYATYTITIYVCTHRYVGRSDLNEKDNGIVDQLGKIFSILGTPTNVSWPDHDCLPNFRKFVYSETNFVVVVIIIICNLLFTRYNACQPIPLEEIFTAGTRG